jgi:hypothetical protein
MDSVHVDGSLNRIPLVVGTTARHGYLEITDNTPCGIVIDRNSSHLELTITHEVGHFMEWKGIPKESDSYRDFEKDDLMRPWLTAVLQTERVKTLIGELDNPELTQEDVAWINYALLPDELWARSYSQYIATKAEAQVLQMQIGLQRRMARGTIQYDGYWTKHDFHPVMDQIDQLFRALGWI